MIEVVLIEILAVPAECSRGRHNPRVVKRRQKSFPRKSGAAPGPRPRQKPFHYPDHIRVVAPAEPPPAAQAPVSPAPRPRRKARQKAETTDPGTTQAIETSPSPTWREHVRAWRDSGMTRAAYCQKHNLEPRTFNVWVGRLRHTFRRNQDKQTTAPA